MNTYYIFLCLICLTISTGSNSKAFSDTYYVDSETGDDNRSGLSTSSAWKTISRVNSADLEPGDNVRFRRGGTYDDAALELDWSGTPDDPAVIGTYGSGEKPLFSFSGHAPLRGWKQQGSYRHVRIQGLDIRVSKGSGIEIGASDDCSYSNITIRNVDIRGVKDANNGILLKYIKGYSILNCTIGDIPNSGIAIIGSSDNAISNGLIARNNIFDISNNDGITLHKNGDGEGIGPAHAVINNVLHDCKEQGLDITSGSKIRAIGNETYENGDSGILVSHGARDVRIHRHYSHDEDQMGIIIGTSSKVKLTSSIVTNPGYHALRINDAKHVEVYHSTIVYGSCSSGSTIDIEGNSKHVALKNNIISSRIPGKPGTFMRFLSGNTASNTDTLISHNIWWGFDVDVTFYDKREGDMNYEEFTSTYSKQTGPGYVKDPHLQFTEECVICPVQGSPAIDAGTQAGVTEDYCGNPIPKGQMPDIGACEY